MSWSRSSTPLAFVSNLAKIASIALFSFMYWNHLCTTSLTSARSTPFWSALCERAGNSSGHGRRGAGRHANRDGTHPVAGRVDRGRLGHEPVEHTVLGLGSGARQARQQRLELVALEIARLVRVERFEPLFNLLLLLLLLPLELLLALLRAARASDCPGGSDRHEVVLLRYA